MDLPGAGLDAPTFLGLVLSREDRKRDTVKVVNLLSESDCAVLFFRLHSSLSPSSVPRQTFRSSRRIDFGSLINLLARQLGSIDLNSNMET